jgi:hypothetical protein
MCLLDIAPARQLYHLSCAEAKEEELIKIIKEISPKGAQDCSPRRKPWVKQRNK